MKTALVSPVVIAVLFCLMPAAYAQTWTYGPSMPTARAFLGLCSHDGRLWGAGGYDGTNALDVFEMYDPDTGAWSTKASLPAPRYYNAMVSLDSLIYVIGGINDSGTMNSVIAYDPATDTWRSKANLLTQRHGPAAAVYNGKIYVFGGDSYGNVLSSVEVYDPASDIWTAKTSMSIPRLMAAVAVVGDKIYVVGGFQSAAGSSLNTLEIYDPLTDTWDNGQDMSIKRLGPSAVGICDKVYVLGGDTYYETLGTVEIFDPSVGDWSQGPAMDTKRRNFGAAVINGTIYAVGGFNINHSPAYYWDTMETLATGCVDTSNPGEDSAVQELEALVETNTILITYDENEYSLLPDPDVIDGWDSFARIENVLGGEEDMFGYSRLYVDGNKIRINDIRIGGVSYWCDLELVSENGGMAYIMRRFEPGWPDADLNSQSLAGIDMSLARADFTGPPLALELSNVISNGTAFWLKFTYADGKFSFKDLNGSKNVHNLDGLIFITAAQNPQLSSGVLQVSGAQYGDFFAFAHTDGDNEERYFEITYEFGTIDQPLIVKDGYASGAYRDYDASTGFSSVSSGRSSGSGFFNRKSTLEELNDYIEREARLNCTLGHDNKLDEALLELATAMVSELKLTTTAAKFRDALLDNMELIRELQKSGSANPETVIKCLGTTFLKTATPEEQAQFVKDFFDDKIPENIDTTTSTIANGKEKTYKEAGAAFTTGLLKTYFARTYATSIAMRELCKYSIDLLRDDITANLYRKYKKYGDLAFTSRNFTANLKKVNDLLRSRGLSTGNGTDKAEAYLKNLFESWKQQEQTEIPALKTELEELRDDYMSLVDYEKKLLLPDGVVNPSETERFKKFIGLYYTILADLTTSMADCETSLNQNIMKDIAFELVKTRHMNIGTSEAQKIDEYNHLKMAYIEHFGCESKITERMVDEDKVSERLAAMDASSIVSIMVAYDGTSILDCMCNRTAYMVFGGRYNGTGDTDCGGTGVCTTAGPLNCNDYDLTVGQTALDECGAVEFVTEKLIEIKQ